MSAWLNKYHKQIQKANNKLRKIFVTPMREKGFPLIYNKLPQNKKNNHRQFTANQMALQHTTQCSPHL